ncbi:MAG TPA: nitroreductase family deazaflavin-dependent oxidoreductase [Actinomycetota bacterium]
MDWNHSIIEEFRSNAGKVGGRFEGQPILLLHHWGAKTGTERVNPLAYQDLGSSSVAVFASKGGAPTNPDWLYNLKANPQVTVEIGDKTFEGKARIAQGEERERIWTRQKERSPGFAEYERRTSREIPVVILDLVAEIAAA